ncbi:DUF1800 domain-containing protein [Novosphingobium sp.]|uniref:DUF1800 domain-containing protein n=1 Tax=Novosphingobium sp. TaxID=1874826 RepID=UPI0025EEA290|nr:DUF1800 domain-containing protein [Novosphingobium sp.]MCC6924732.1 DUF1800 domain-containing protein [Novosphingobium sp.]
MDKIATALNRFGLGGKLGESPPADPRGWLEAQFARFDPRPAAIAAQTGTPQLVTMLREARDDRRERKDEAKQDGTDPKAKVDGEPGPFRDLRDAYTSAVGARTDAALASDTPFVERLVHFWSNHFAVSVDKVAVIGLAGAFEFEAIRPHVLGRFSDMLNAVERHPAMLLYLDQAESVGPESPLAQRASRRGRERGLNENLAREILELHTLGVRTGYSQADVTEFARALTGWTVGGLAKQPLLRGPGPGFWFAAPIHQPGSRSIIGKRYGQAGEAQAQAVLDDLARHPATARHVATKLARHFAADDPPPALVARLEADFLRNGGDLKSLYRVLLASPECWQGAPKFRTPWDWTLAALRATGIKALPGRNAAGGFQQLGQAIWKPGSPAGYDDVAPSWAGPDALYRRVEVAQRIADRAAPAIDARTLAEALFPQSLSQSTREAITRAESGPQALALLLASPEMMRR